MAFYIKTLEGDFYYLDAVVSVGYSQQGSVTEYAVEDGSVSSDHYTQIPDTLNFSGEVSAVKFVRNGNLKTNLAVFEEGLQALKKSGQKFSCVFSPNLAPLNNCLFTNLQFDRDASTGLYAVKVSFTVRQVKVVNQATIVTSPVAAEEYKDTVEAKRKGSGSTTETDEQEENSITKTNAGLLTFAATGEFPDA